MRENLKGSPGKEVEGVWTCDEHYIGRRAKQIKVQRGG